MEILHMQAKQELYQQELALERRISKVRHLFMVFMEAHIGVAGPVHLRQLHKSYYTG